jgi:hypothetical protein
MSVKFPDSTQFNLVHSEDFGVFLKFLKKYKVYLALSENSEINTATIVAGV